MRAVIFDVDGTLVDSNDQHAMSWCDALSEFGRAVPFEQVRPLIGMGGDKLLPRAAGIPDDSPEGKKISKRRAEIFRQEYLPTIKAFPMARDLCLRLREAHYELAVASSAQKADLLPLLKIAEVDDLLAEKTSSSDAENSKPDPDIVSATIKKLGLNGADAVMIGDTPYDVEAAEKAGVRTIAFRCGGWDDQALRGAIALYDGPADLYERFDESPLTR
jgi:HAD superfamily hydrolase (TIGR01509 family)